MRRSFKFKIEPENSELSKQRGRSLVAPANYIIANRL